MRELFSAISENAQGNWWPVPKSAGKLVTCTKKRGKTCNWSSAGKHVTVVKRGKRCVNQITTGLNFLSDWSRRQPLCSDWLDLLQDFSWTSCEAHRTMPLGMSLTKNYIYFPLFFQQASIFFQRTWPKVNSKRYLRTIVATCGYIIGEKRRAQSGGFIFLSCSRIDMEVGLLAVNNEVFRETFWVITDVRTQ